MEKYLAGDRDTHYVLVFGNYALGLDMFFPVEDIDLLGRVDLSTRATEADSSGARPVAEECIRSGHLA